MHALNDVIVSGKVRYIGASSMSAWEFQELQYVAKKNGWCKFISMQDYYNLISREEETKMISFCNHIGVGLIPWRPVARGAPTRPCSDRTTLRENTDEYLKTAIHSREGEADKEIIDRVEKVSKEVWKRMAQVARRGF